jgi:hypothetical protein
VAGLFDQADVTVKLTSTDVAHLAAGSDAQLDALVSELSQAGMDQLQLDAAQVTVLSHAGGTAAGGSLSFNDGSHVTVVGTSFLGGGANIHAVAGLFDQADVTVKLTSTDVAHLAAGSDAQLDALVSELSQAGVDQIELDAGQSLQLAGNGALTFNTGTEIVVNGANALGSAAGAAASEHLFGAADLTVKLSDTDVAHLAASSDARLDALVDQLSAAGMDHLQLSAPQVDTLAHADGGALSFNDGTHLTVVGTEFLGGGANVHAVASLLDQADVTVRLDGSDVADIVHGSDSQLDALVSQLRSAGMDRLELDAGQALQLAGNSALSFSAGSEVMVDGAHALGGAAGVAASDHLFGAADLTVKLSDTDVGHLTAGTDSELDALVGQLSAAGMDHLQLDAAQLSSLAHAGSVADGTALSFNAGTHVIVVGTAFLGDSAASAAVHHLLGAADVTLQLQPSDNPLLQALLDHPANAAPLAQQALAAGIDHIDLGQHLALTSDQALDLASALQGLSLAADDALLLTDGQALLGQLLGGDGLSATALDALHDFAGHADLSVQLGMADLGQQPAAEQAEQADLATALHALQTELGQAGVDHLVLTDDLAAALAQSDIGFLDARSVDAPLSVIEVVATTDTSDGIAYLRSTLQDLEEVGVQKVVLDSHVTEAEVALHGVGVTISRDLRLEDLPRFQHTDDQSVALVLDAVDLAALMTAPQSFNALHANGFTELRLTDPVDDSALSDLQSALHDSGLHWASAPLSNTEVQLLGLSADQDPGAADPFHPHTPKP